MAEYTKPPLDESFYDLTEEDLVFIKAQSGIEDPDTLKPKIYTFPMYEHVLDLGRKGGIVLDLGKCWSDGIPAQNLIASDLWPVFWDLGHELFNSTPATFPAAFLAGDTFDPAFLEPFPPLTPSSDVPVPAAPAPLNSLTNLAPLRGHLAAIHATCLFHLFLEPQQAQLARALGGLLAPAPGAVILGSHVGRRAKGANEKGPFCSGGHRMFCHSPSSWKEQWKGIFSEGAVEVRAELREKEKKGWGNERRVEDEQSDTHIGQPVWPVARLRFYVRCRLRKK
ncbi:hypothetical protein DFH08DRAFT_949457 [Mycena albidolilacea]|uniref:Uncharacterized protein n=1 Tax=Mycena albidolilacea TaxID=1033008 RepID=A0AAD7AMW0_9AGAR|nr:hypothetical protein DFH08DRAFT_949457 [Mycena albidolilacea]